MQTREEPRVLPLPGASRERQHLPRQACGGHVFRHWVLREPPLAFSPPPALGGGVGLTTTISQGSPPELRAIEQRGQGHQVTDSRGRTHTRALDPKADPVSPCAKWSLWPRPCLPDGVLGV